MNSNYTCEWCGRQHDGSYSKRFCSGTCIGKYARSNVDETKFKDIKCTICGKTMRVKNISNNKNRICKECKKAKQRQQYKERAHRLQGNEDLICEWCGRQHDGSYSKRFCCISCAKKFAVSKTDHNKLKDAKCVICGKAIKIKYNASTKNCVCSECDPNTHSNIIPNSIQNTNNEHKYECGRRKCQIHHKCKICGKPMTATYSEQSHQFAYRKICSDECRRLIQPLRTFIKYFGFDKTKIGTPEVFDEVQRIRNMLYKDYWIDNMPSGLIVKKYNYPKVSNLVAKVFRYLNIPIKTLSQAKSNNALVYGMSQKIARHAKYMQGWHTTWDGNDVFLRSSYEFDYAKELDNQKIHYEVESLRIKYFNTRDNDYRCAIPDFYIPSTNTIVEIKSKFTLDKPKMIDKFNEYKRLGYNTKLIFEHKETDIYSIDVEKLWAQEKSAPS